MRLLGWLTRGRGARRGARHQWRSDWAAAAALRDAHALAALRERLTSDFSPEEDVELEREMLDGLDALISLLTNLQQGSIPVIDTTHRVVADEACHFTAPASMPDVAGAPSGRLLLTRSRAVFVGTGGVTRIPLHAISKIVEDERDLLVGRTDVDSVYRLRFNTYGDAMLAGALAGHLMDALRGSPRN